MASYPFPGIELEHEYDPEPQLDNSIPFPNSIMTQVSLLDVNPLPESVLDPVPIHYEIESPILYDHHIEFDQFILLKVPLTNW